MDELKKIIQKQIDKLSIEAHENGPVFALKVILVSAILNTVLGNMGMLMLVSVLVFGYYLMNEKYTEIEEDKVDETNQYLNFDVYDIGEESPPNPYNDDPEKMNNKMEVKTHVDNFLDMDAIFEKKNAQRQFHTVTHDKYDSREKFVNWACMPDQTCKTEQRRCMKWHDDIRGTLYN